MKTNESNNRKQILLKIFKIYLSIILFMNVFLMAANAQQGDQPDVLDIYCSEDIYSLTKSWSDGFQMVHPEIVPDVIPLATKDLYRKAKSGEYLVFASASSYEKMESLPAWNLPLGREIYVPVYNTGNPLAIEIEKKGISPEVLSTIIKTPENKGWESITGSDEYIPVNLYRLSSAPLQACIGGFLHTDNFGAVGTEVADNTELMKRVKKDPFALTFCKLNDILNPEKNCFEDGVKLLPIDRNGNGQIDYFEDIYDNPYEFGRGVWIGKYPRMLVNNILVMGEKPLQNSDEMAFLKWVLTEGQSELAAFGYSDLIAAERQSKVARLIEEKSAIETGSKLSGYKNVLLVVILLLLVGVVVNIIYRYVRRKKFDNKPVSARSIGVLSEDSLNIPDGLYFDKTHTWAFMEKDGNVKIGIDDFLQRITGDFNTVRPKQTGDKVKKNEQIISLGQDGKQISLYSPISGTIKQINERVLEYPSLINKATYSDGWILMMEPSNWLREIQFLKMAKKYREWIKMEFVRLRDFLSASFNGPNGSQKVAFQDGGEIMDHILKDCGPEVWEDFQKNFIDTSELK